MTQEHANELLSEYLDGELTDAEVAELEHRLARDPGLQQELDQLRAAVDLLRTHGPVQAPPSLYASIMELVDEEPVAGGFWRWLQRPFGVPLQTLVVVAVAMLVIGVSVGGVLTVQGLDMSTSREITSSAVSDGKSAPDPDGWADAEPEPAKNANEPTLGAADGDGEYQQPAPPQAATEATTPIPMEKIAAAPEPTMDKLGYDPAMTQNAMPVGTADDETVGEASASRLTNPATTSGTSKKTSGDIVKDPMQHKLTVRPDDLELVAKLYARYAGSRGSAKVAAAIAGAEPGQQTLFQLPMPDPAARNQFLTELQRMFPGAYRQVLTTDDTMTVDSARVNLVLYVSDLAPSGQADPGQVKSLRSKKRYEADAEESSAPATTESPAK